MFIPLNEAVATFNKQTNKEISINKFLQFALNGKIALSILYDGKARVYESADESIKDIYGWFDIPPRCFADIINHQQSNINTLFTHNSYSVLVEGISATLTATLDNIFIAEQRLNELIRLNIGETIDNNKRPLMQQRYQEDEILRVIGELGFNAKAIPKMKAGKSGVKADVRKKLSFSVSVFDKAWERLRANNDIQDEK
jgi:hypothetical protein